MLFEDLLYYLLTLKWSTPLSRVMARDRIQALKAKALPTALFLPLNLHPLLLLIRNESIIPAYVMTGIEL